MANRQCPLRLNQRHTFRKMKKSHHRHSHHHDSKAKKITIYCLVGFNVAITLVMILSAFSGTLAPQDHPKLSVLPLLFPFLLLANILLAVMWLFIRKKFALISLAGMLLCITDIRAICPINLPSTAPQGSIKVMSFNVGNNQVDKNPELIEYITKSNPDILCLQECNTHSKILEDTVIKQNYPYIEYNENKASTVVCLSKYPITSAENINYESKGNSSSAYNVLIDKDTMLIVNNHFQSYLLKPFEIDEYKGITGKSTSMEEREKGTKDIVSKVSEANKKRGPQVDKVCEYIDKHFKRHTIVVGDFNEPPTSYAHYKLTKKLKDAFTRAGNGLGFTYSRNKIHYRIDHILYSDNMTPYETEVDKSCKISDHYPIFCYFKLD